MVLGLSFRPVALRPVLAGFLGIAALLALAVPAAASSVLPAAVPAVRHERVAADATLRLPGLSQGADERWFFEQPTTSSTLTLVVEGGAPAEIAGVITTNGGLRIVSPSGLDVTPTARLGAARVALSTARDEIRVMPAGHQPGGTVVRGTLRQAGRIEAGEIHLAAGLVEAEGVFDASGVSGGRITMSGDYVAVLDAARIDASGERGGGQILIGGDYQGATIAGQRTARRTFVAAGARMLADAHTAGAGGRIVVWSDELTRFLGQVSARGGARSGVGGFAEVSGKGHLDYRGLADLRAPVGATGTLLLDPTDITITGAGSDTAPTFGSFAGGTFDGGANPTSTIFIGTGVGDVNPTLLKQLASANVVITTASAGVGTGNINVTGAIAFTSANSLTLTAGNNLTVSSSIANTGSGGLIFSSGGTMSLAASVTTNGTLTAQANSGITVSGAVAAVGATFNADQDNDGAGIMTVGAAGSINSGGSPLSITASDAVFDGTVTSGAGLTTVTASANRTIGVGAGAGNLSLNGTDLAAIASSGGLKLVSSGTITVASVSAANTAALGATTLETSGAGNITFSGASTFANSIATRATGTGRTNLGADVTSNAGKLTFGGAGAGGVALAGATVQLQGSTGIDLDALTGTGANELYLVGGSGAINGTSVASSVDKLNLLGTGAVTFTQLVAPPTSVNLAGHGTGAVNFSSGLTTGTLTTGTNAYALTQTGGTITNAATYSNVGLVTLSGVTFSNGVDASSGPTGVVLSGAIQATAAAAGLSFGATSLSTNTSLQTLNGAIAIGTVTGGTRDLTLRAGTGAITLAGVSAVGELSTSGGGAVTFSAAVSATTIDLLGKTGGSVTFQGNVTATSLITANAGYSVSLTGSSTVVTNAVNFLNTGTVTLGDGAGDVLRFAGGLATTGNATNPSTTFIGGAVRTDGQTISLGAVSLSAAATIDATNNGGTAVGAVIAVGTITAGSNDITMRAGTAGNITVVGIAGANAFTVAGADTITLGGTVNATSASLTSKTLALGANNLNVGAGAATLNQSVAVTSSTGSIVAGSLTLNGAGVVGSSGTSLPTSATALVLSKTAGNTFVSTSGGVTLAGTTGSGALNVGASGAIAQGGSALTVGGTTTLSASANPITLNNVANQFATISANTTGSNDISVAAGATIDLGTVNAGQKLTVNTTGNITNSGVLTVAGNLDVTAGGDVTLGTATNSFGGAIALTVPATANVTLVDTTAVDLPALTVGSLGVVAGGSITQDGTLTVTNLANFKTLNDVGAAITLADNSNAFGSLGAQVRTANDGADATAAVNLHETGGTAIAGLRTAGGLTLVTNGGALTQTGSVVVGGTTSLTAGSASIDLTNSGNNFTGAVSISNSGANAVAITDTNALKLGNVTVGTSTLTINANVGGTTDVSGISQLTGTTITSAGAASFIGGAGNITLSNANNNFSGTVAVSNAGANPVSLRDEAGGIVLATSIVGSDLTITSSGGAVTEVASNTLTVPGILRLIAGAFDATLTQNNTLNRVVIESANTTSLTSVSGLSLGDNTGTSTGTSTVGGNFVATVTGGAVAQTEALNVTGTTTINANANAVTLTNSGNDFTGAVSLNNSGANDLAINDTNALTLDTLTIGRNLTVRSGALALQKDVTATGATVTLNHSEALTQATGKTITAATLNLEGIGAVGTGPSGRINTAVDTIRFGKSTGAGDTFLAEADAVTLTGGTQGAVNITSGGTVTLNEFLAAGGLTAPGAALALSGTITGPMTFGGDVTLAGGTTLTGAVTLGKSGGLAINAGNFSLTFGNAVTLTSAVGATGGTSALTFNGTIDGAFALTLTTGSGGVKLLGVVGGTTPLTGLTINGTGTLILGTTITAGAGGQSFNVPVQLVADTTLNDTAAITFNGTVDGDGNGPWALTVNAAGATTFAAAVGGTKSLASLVTDATAAAGVHKGGTTSVKAVTTSGAQTFNDNVTLNGTYTTGTAFTAAGTTTLAGVTLIDATPLGTNTTFTGAVDGAFDLKVWSRTTTFSAAVGATVPLASLQVDNGNLTSLKSVTTTGGQTINTPVTLNGTYTTSGAEFAVFAAATLGGPTTVSTGAGNVSINGVNGGHTLTVNSTGTTRFFAAVGGTTPLAGLITNAGGTTFLRDVTTTGGQTYNDAVSLSANTTLTTSNNAVVFSSTLDSATATARNLTVNAGSGVIAFTGATDGTNALGAVALNSTDMTLLYAAFRSASLVTNAGGSTLLNGVVTTTGAKTFNDPVVTITSKVIDFGTGPGQSGQYTSHAVVNGNPAIAYYNASESSLMFARNSAADGSGTWTVTTLDYAGDVGVAPSLAVVNGRPAVSYHDAGSFSLKYVVAKDAGGTNWGAPVTVATGANASSATALAVVNGAPAIAYYDGLNADLQYVRANDAAGAAWSAPVTVDSTGDVGQDASLAVVNGNPAISYFDVTNGDLKYVRAGDASGTGWGAPVIVDSAGTVGQNTSLAVVGGNPAISYFDATNGDLKYARAGDVGGAGWGAAVTVDSAGTVGQHTSLVVVNGNPAISYNDGSNQDLKYVRAADAAGAIWGAPLTIDSAGAVGQYTSLAVVNGNPAVSYYDASNQDLKYVRATDAGGASWGAPVTADAGVQTGAVGSNTTAAVVNGNPAVCYYDISNSSLKFVRAGDPAGTSWGTPVTVTASGGGTYMSLAVVNGNPAISYWDGTDLNLKYVRANDANGTSWGTTVVVDNDFNVGLYTALVVVNGNPAISYYAQTGQSLKYVRASDTNGATWGAPVTVGFGGSGTYTSLAIVNGNPAIGYYTQPGQSLLFARATDADGTAWGAPVTVDNVGDVGRYASLEVVNGSPALSYYDQTNGDVKYVRASDANGAAWGTPLILDSPGNVGQYTSLAVVNGLPAVSYYDVDNGDLKYVRASDASGTAWTSPLVFDSPETVGSATSLVVVNGVPGISHHDITNNNAKWSTFSTLTAPVVTSPTSASITALTATLGGDVSSDGGAAVTARGIVFAPTATNASPQIGGVGVTTIAGSGTTGVFTVSASGLTATTAYSFAAYATNSIGTAYSAVGTFNATPPTPVVTNGTLTLGATYGTAIATYTITGSNTPTSFSATGLPAGLVLDTSTGAITGTPTTTVGSPFSVTLGATNAGGTGTATLVITVAKPALTVTANTGTRAYGAANPAFTATITGFVNGDTAAVVTGSASLSTTATVASAVGNYPITAAAGSLTATNYTFAPVDGTLAITKAPLTVTADPKARIYGAANPSLTATITGFVNGETLATSGVTGAAALATTATTATGVSTPAITAAVVTLTSTNYAFTSFTNSTLTITKAPLTVTADNKSRTYGAANPTLTATITGFVNSETSAVVTGAPALGTVATPTSGVGTYPISAAAGTLAAANYSFAFTAGTLTVGKAPLTVTAVDKSRTYGAANPTLTATITGFVNGETSTLVSGTPALSTVVTPTSGVGTYPIVAAAGTLAAANYSFAFTAGTLTVTKAPLTVAADDKSRFYGAANPTLTAMITGFVNSETSAVLTGTPALSTTAMPTSGVGTYTIVAAAGTLAAANYSFAFTAGTLTVTKAQLAVTADDKSRTYGAANPALTATITGFVNGETSAVVTGTPALSTVATPTSGVGTYAISAAAGTLAAANYSFTFTPGTLTVAMAPTTAQPPNVGATEFAANWTKIPAATSYRLDVSTSPTFATFVPGYQDLDVGNITCYTITGLPAATAHYYRVRAVSAGGASASSNTVALTTFASLSAARQVVAAGQNVTLSVTPGGAGPFTYQWRKNGFAVAGATSSSFTVTTARSKDNGYYQVVVTDGNGSSTSRALFVNVVIGTAHIAQWGSVANGQNNPRSIVKQNVVEVVPKYQKQYLASDGTIIQIDPPFPLYSAPSGLANVVSLQSGTGAFFTALKSDGTVVAWGDNTVGQLTGIPAGLNNVVKVCPGTYQTFAVLGDGSIVGWGAGNPALPADLSNVASVAVGNGHALAVKQDGTVVAWETAPGFGNFSGQATVPVSLTNVIAVAAGYYHSLALRSDGTVVAWGKNDVGQTNVPAGLSGVIAIESDRDLNIALKSDGSTVTWGGPAGPTYTAFTPPAWVSSVVAVRLSEESMAIIDATNLSAPVVTPQVPSSQVVVVGGSVSLSAAVTGSPAPSLQWQRIVNGSLVDLTNDGTYSGVNTATLTINGVTAARDKTSFYLVASNPAQALVTTIISSLDVRPADVVGSHFESSALSAFRYLVLENGATGERVIWRMLDAKISTSFALPTFTAGWHFAGTGDFNGDLKGDIVLQNTTSGERVVWLMNGTTISSSVALPTLPLAWQIACVGDLNVDGKPDIVLQNTQTNERVVWFMNGTAIAGSYNPPALPAAWQFCGIMDFSGDGLPDLLIQNTDTGERVIWVLNAQLGITRSIDLPTFYAGWRFAGIGRFTADNLPNIILQNTLNGERVLWSINTAGAITASTALPTLPVAWSFAGPALNRAKAPVGSDLNRDGKPDILVTDTTSGERILWTMNGTAIAGSVALPTLPSSWQFVGTGDFNADGMNDILLQNSSTGDRQIWLMNGTSIAGVTALPTLPTTWSLAAVGDINQDGQPDIVLENRSTGARVIWLMDKTAISASVDLPTIPVSWTIAAAGNFSAGGQPTLLLENTSSGERTFWVLNTAGSLQQSLGLPSFLGGWRFAGAAPYFGGTKPHILLQNLSSGERVIWRMDNASIAASSSVVSLPVNYILKN